MPVGSFAIASDWSVRFVGERDTRPTYHFLLPHYGNPEVTTVAAIFRPWEGNEEKSWILCVPVLWPIEREPLVWSFVYKRVLPLAFRSTHH